MLTRVSIYLIDTFPVWFISVKRGVKNMIFHVFLLLKMTYYKTFCIHIKH